MEFTKIYTQGKYTIGVGEELIRFQRTLQDFKDNIECLTNDKVLIGIDFSLQYEYNKESLIPIILKKFKSDEKYKNFISNLMISSIMNTCLSFTAEQYYVERSIIDKKMSNNLLKNINDNDLGLDIQNFQLINIKFPSNFSYVIQQKQNIQQYILTATNNRQSDITNANTILLQADRTAKISIINANNTALININKATTDANIQNELWIQRTYAYSNIVKSLGLNTSQLIDYIKSDIMRNSNNLITSNNI